MTSFTQAIPIGLLRVGLDILKDVLPHVVGNFCQLTIPTPSSRGIVQSRFITKRILVGLKTEYSVISSQPHTISRIVIQEHLAKRAGHHFDLRIVVNGKAISFATKKEMPEVGEKIQLFRQPDHTKEYMDFEGKLEEGWSRNGF